MGGLSPASAAYATIGCFLGGVIVIQFVSRFLHRCIPSNIVGCGHSHGNDSSEHNGEPREAISQADNKLLDQQLGKISEATPLLYRADTTMSETTLSNPARRRASSLIHGNKVSCNGEGPCYGYSNPCDQECFKGVCGVNGAASKTAIHSSMLQTYPGSLPGALPKPAKLYDEEALANWPEFTNDLMDSSKISQGPQGNALARRASTPILKSSHAKKNADQDSHKLTSSVHETSDESAEPHHHHIAKNAFLAIGLQTSIAIALHKLPEGFITFATNHANPKLGFLVFMALFIHNITEGYAMALPLYLALQSRWKAIFWSSLLGGISQPLGAGIAALWFNVAGKTGTTPGETVYGCMFAITAGVMTSVALQLFSESIDIAHNGNLCIAFAFVGMGILGLSFALTAG